MRYTKGPRRLSHQTPGHRPTWLEIEPVKSNRMVRVDIANRPAKAIVDICPITNDYGDPCGRSAIPIAPFAICGDHARELYQHVSEYVARVENDPMFRLGLAWNSMDQHNRREAARPVPVENGFVYYVQIGNHIKIGHTIDLGGRMRSYPPTRRLLAVEPGGRQLEYARLTEFRHLLDAGQEWFRPGPDLIAYVNTLRATAGSEPIPDAAA